MQELSEKELKAKVADLLKAHKDLYVTSDGNAFNGNEKGKKYAEAHASSWALKVYHFKGSSKPAEIKPETDADAAKAVEAQAKQSEKETVSQNSKPSAKKPAAKKK